MTDQQKAHRLALIKSVAEKQKRQKSFVSKMNTKSSVAEGNVQATKFVRKTAKIAGVKNDQMNINQYTDASKYADQYYGETMRETTKYDNDWG